MLQPKKPVVKKATKKTNNDVQMYKGPKGEVLSGEGTNRGPNYNMLKKNGGKVIKKAKAGTSFGALSVKAGVDDNYGITAADRISGAKMNKGKAKSGATMKMGGKMKTCKGGC